MEKKTAKGKGDKSSSKISEENQSALLELFIDGIKDLYWAEKHLGKALPKMQSAATSEELQNAFESHLEQTEEHVARLEEIFQMLEEKPQAEIADILGISVSNVATKVARIKEQLRQRFGAERRL